MILASGDKKHEIYNVFWPVPSKNTNTYAVFRLLGFVEGAERGCTEMTSNLLNNQVTGLATVPFTS